MNRDYRCRSCGDDQGRELYSGIRDWEYGVEGSWAYYACSHCNGVQLHPFPNLEDLRRAYDIDYHGYASGQERGLLFAMLYRGKEWLFRRRMKRLVEPGSRVLDVGCGAGDFLLGLRSLGLEDLQGIDFSADMVTRLKAMGMTGYEGTYLEFPGTPDSYDLVAMNNYLEHTLDPDAELDKTLQLLRPGGYLVGEVPGFDSPDRVLFGRYWGGNHAPRHTFQFGPQLLRQRLQQAGFVDISISHQLNPSHWALSVQNLCQRNQADLRDNRNLQHGRARYYLVLVILLAPLCALAALTRHSSCIKFYARKPVPG